MWLEISGRDKKWLLENLPPGKDWEWLRGKVEKAARIKPRSAKGKGLAWQKEVCQLIADILGVEYDQQDDCCDIHSRESGLAGVDVIIRGDARRRYDYDIECKAAESIHLPEWIGQARSNSAGDNWKLFIKNRSVGKIVCMPIEAYKKIMTMIYALGGSGDGK